MKDNAISAVIAYMILLTITVSFIALLNAVWIPQMKQQSEIEHLNNVQDTFLSLRTDIDRLISYRQNSSITHSIQLGGGDVLFSPIKSSGTMEIIKKDLSDSITANSLEIRLNSIKINYSPIMNFWIDQGYSWENGTIYLNKYNLTRNTPLDIESSPYTFIEEKFVPQIDSIARNAEKTNVSISLVTFGDSDNSFIGGNSFASVFCKMECPVYEINTLTGSTEISGNWIQELNLILNKNDILHQYDNINKKIVFDNNVTVNLKVCSLRINLL